jgi:hypothetical protein
MDFVKEEQVAAGIRWEEGVDCRESRSRGSKARREGVKRALRFWVIGSSIEARERRRKSGCTEN